MSDGGSISGSEAALDVSLSVNAPRGELSSDFDSDGGRNAMTVSFPVGGDTSSSFFVSLPLTGPFSLEVDGGASIDPISFAVSAGPFGHRGRMDGPNVLRSAGGEWSSLSQTDAAAALRSSAFAAHEGDGGLLISFDGGSVSTAGSGSYVVRNMSRVQGELFVRAWMRLDATNGIGNLIPLNMNSGDLSALPVIDFRIQSSGKVGVGGYDRSGAYFTNVSTFSATDAGWFLSEIYAHGIGGNDGGVEVYANGSPIAQAAGIDWTGLNVFNNNLGSAWLSDRRWKGHLSIDELRVSAVQPASRMEVVAPFTLEQGACTEVFVIPFSSEGNAVPAPRDYALALSVTNGNGGVFANPTCTGGASISVGEGYVGGFAFVQPSTTGPLDITVSHPDLLPSSTTLTVVPPVDGGVVTVADGGTGVDGGTDAGVADGGADAGSRGPDAGVDAGGGGERNLRVGCGCNDTLGGPMILVALLALGRRRRVSFSPSLLSRCARF